MKNSVKISTLLTCSLNPLHAMAYNVNFISGKPVTLPVIPPQKKKEVAPLINGKGYLINYAHHTVVLNKKRNDQ